MKELRDLIALAVLLFTFWLWFEANWAFKRRRYTLGKKAWFPEEHPKIDPDLIRIWGAIFWTAGLVALILSK